jgi:tetratricopeptide (TPR) repeat protein
MLTRCCISAHLAWVVAVGLALLTSTAVAQSIDQARRDIQQLRFDRAQEQLVDIARRTNGVERQEALFLLAGLKNSVSEAEIIYQEVISIDDNTEWADRATVELAKVHYALGNYGRSFTMLRESAACRELDEACYFEGLSAIMLERYADAKSPMSSVRRGKYRPWAFLALAEIDMNLDDPDGACDRYRSMARAALSPTAMYRYGECLEKKGEADRAANVFEDVIREFEATPEAVLAEEKLAAIHKRASGRVSSPAPRPPLPTTGFTLQFGAFHDRENAIRLAAEIKKRLPGVRIDSDLLEYREVHRVRFGHFATRAEAESEGEKLKLSIDEPFTIMLLP